MTLVCRNSLINVLQMRFTSPLFAPEVHPSAGDLIFFFREKNGDRKTNAGKNENTQERDAICAVSSNSFADAFHVGIIVERRTQNQWAEKDKTERIVHAARDEVRVDPLGAVVAELRPTRVELCRMALDDPWWGRRAAKWAEDQCGAAYNDIYSEKCVNSRGQRAFYCCQLAVEAFKATNPTEKDVSPFLPHALNFAGNDGQILPFWMEHYKKLCPHNPMPPQGRPGSHPSKLRASPCVLVIGSRKIEKKEEKKRILL
ncbi:hypothetical protein niasHS_007648 [Heterodera schachtii]|uniref:Uncharacterized protein n=1 Tax=Heterodera schachtii TaxID=97005 RepID=A0ABD2JPP6_HETSC